MRHWQGLERGAAWSCELWCSCFCVRSGLFSEGSRNFESFRGFHPEVSEIWPRTRRSQRRPYAGAPRRGRSAPGARRAAPRPAPRRRCHACVAAEPVPLPTSPKDVATQMSYAVQARTCPTHLRRSYVLLSYLVSYVLGYVLSYVVSHASAQPMDVATPCRQRSKEIATDIAKKGIARRR